MIPPRTEAILLPKKARRFKELRGASTAAVMMAIGIFEPNHHHQ
jgi:hypothetical protein